MVKKMHEPVARGCVRHSAAGWCPARRVLAAAGFGGGLGGVAPPAAAASTPLRVLGNGEVGDLEFPEGPWPVRVRMGFFFHEALMHRE